MSKLNSEQWSQFWDKNTLTTFHGHFEGNYDGEIKQFWFELFAQTNPNLKIVDLASGNGALALLIEEFNQLNSRGHKISAVDFADIKVNEATEGSESLTKLKNNINFYSNTNIENTGFDDNSFDMAISQFGFEYADHEKAFNEVDRILNDTGRVAFIMHISESVIIKQAFEALEQIRVCNRTGLIETVGLILARLDKLPKNAKDDVADKLKKDINKQLSFLTEQMKKYAEPTHIQFFIDMLSRFFAQEASLMTLEEKQQTLENLKVEIKKYKERMLDLKSAALDKEGLLKLNRLAESKNYKLRLVQPIYYNKNLFGVTFVADKIKAS